ncbi:hypothetical protein Gasu2_11840 [Galdieria sulphuraria]|nr:hypothetical protein Gasu2_11840 [Galdieria sulphuraria]
MGGGDRNSEGTRTAGSVRNHVQTLMEEQTPNEEDANVVTLLPAVAMETLSDPKLQTVSKMSEERSTGDPHSTVQPAAEERSKLLPKKRSRRPPVPLGQVKYPTREVLKYEVVVVGIRGTICKQDVDQHSNNEVLFEDVRLAWSAWKAVGVQVALVTNSISFVQAKNILGEELFSYIVQYFDEETIGPLDLPDTYIAMAKKLQTSPNKILFAGSVYEHVAAASEAGLQVAIVVRYDNPPLPRDVRYKMCTKLTHLIPASLLIDKTGYVSSEGSTTSC